VLAQGDNLACSRMTRVLGNQQAEQNRFDERQGPGAWRIWAQYPRTFCRSGNAIRAVSALAG
jgi:hypothetical protein